MRLLVVVAFAASLLLPVVPASALNPQPEPPGRAKIKRIYTGGPDSRRNKTIKQPVAPVAPATKY